VESETIRQELRQCTGREKFLAAAGFLFQDGGLRLAEAISLRMARLSCCDFVGMDYVKNGVGVGFHLGVSSCPFC
jgi:hypothetical protein